MLPPKLLEMPPKLPANAAFLTRNHATCNAARVPTPHGRHLIDSLPPAARSLDLVRGATTQALCEPIIARSPRTIAKHSEGTRIRKQTNDRRLLPAIFIIYTTPRHATPPPAGQPYTATHLTRSMEKTTRTERNATHHQEPRVILITPITTVSVSPPTSATTL